ncbi:hypothetical protein D3C73_646820 [compost metagenome]
MAIYQVQCAETRSIVKEIIRVVFAPIGPSLFSKCWTITIRHSYIHAQLLLKDRVKVQHIPRNGYLRRPACIRFMDGSKNLLLILTFMTIQRCSKMELRDNRIRLIHETNLHIIGFIRTGLVVSRIKCDLDIILFPPTPLLIR